MEKIKRVFLIVLDSVGIGELPDADKFGDKGSNTLKAISSHPSFACENLKKLGLFGFLFLYFGQLAQKPTPPDFKPSISH